MFNFLKKFFVKETLFTPKKTEKPVLVDEKVLGYINPIWEVEIVDYDGKQITKMPFCFMVHTYLKDYGFSPDSQVTKSPEIILRIGKGAEAKLPLFVKSIKSDWGQVK